MGHYHRHVGPRTVFHTWSLQHLFHGIWIQNSHQVRESQKTANWSCSSGVSPSILQNLVISWTHSYIEGLVFQFRSCRSLPHCQKRKKHSRSFSLGNEPGSKEGMADSGVLEVCSPHIEVKDLAPKKGGLCGDPHKISIISLLPIPHLQHRSGTKWKTTLLVSLGLKASLVGHRRGTQGGSTSSNLQLSCLSHFHSGPWFFIAICKQGILPMITNVRQIFTSHHCVR